MADIPTVKFEDLTPEQQQEALAQMGTSEQATPETPTQPQVPEGTDAVDSMSPDQLVELSVKTNGDFDPVNWALSNPDRLQDPSTEAKLADTVALLRKRGFKFEDVSLKKGAKAVVDMGVGLFKWGWRAQDLAIATPYTWGAKKLFGGDKPADDYLKKQAAKSGELLAATETGVTGLGDLVRKAGSKVGTFAGIFKSADEQDPQERLHDFRAAMGRAQQFQTIAEGGGEATKFITGGVLEDLKSEGYEVNPEAVQAMAMGDPVTFLALPGGIKLVTGTGKTLAKVTSRTQAVNLLSKLRTAQRNAAAAGVQARAAASQTQTAASAAVNAEKVAQANQALQAARAEVQGSVGARARLSPAQAENFGVKPLPEVVAAPVRAGQAVSRAVVEPIEGAARAVAASPAAAAAADKLQTFSSQIETGVGRGIDVAVGAGVGATGLGTRVFEKMVGPAVGGVAGYTVGGPVGAAVGGAAGRLVAKSMPRVEAAGKAMMKSGGQAIRGETAAYSPKLRLISDIAKSAPNVATSAAKGFIVLDVPFAAVTSESPAETANMPVFGAFFGAGSGLARGAQRVVQGQLAAPRNWGSNAPLRNYRSFSGLDEATRMSVDMAENPMQAERFAALRQFIEPTGAQMYWVQDKAVLGDMLKRLVPDASEQWHQEAVNQRGVTLKATDDAGVQRNIILLRDVEAAPHEVMHAYEHVLGPKAMEAIDQIVYNEYAPLWDDLGQNYVARFFDGPTLAEYGKRGEGWQEALIDIQRGSPEWREQLAPDQVDAQANHYLSREVSAELADTVLRNTGPELLQDPGIVGKFARILGKTMVGLGIEPFEGVRSEGQGVPIRMETADTFRESLRTGIDDLKVDQRREAVLNKPPYSAKPAPGTPEAPAPRPDKTEAATEARKIAASEPDLPPARGMRSRKEVLNDVASAIETGGALKVDYLSAPGEPAGAISSNRAVRRAVIEAFRTMPADARALWEKNFFPDKVIKTSSGKIQIQGWTPEVFAANAQKLAKALVENKAVDLSPYQIDVANKTFTPEGWQELYRDTTAFVENQQAGATGAGQPLVVPREVTSRGFRAPEETGPAPAALSQDRADVISALFGIPIPKTNRISGFPRNLAGQMVSEATAPGRVSVPVEPRAPFEGPKAEALGIAGEQVREVNPFRAELDRRGIKVSTIEAIQRLNLERIVDVAGAPEVPAFRGNEFTLQAGFQPKTEAGKKLADSGITFERLGGPGNRTLTAKRGDTTVGQILSVASLEDPNAVRLAGIDVVPAERRKGIAEALYRELLTDLQSDGANKLTGDVVAEGPLKIREKVLPGETKLRDFDGNEITFEQALDSLPRYDEGSRRWVMSAVKAETNIPAGAKFQPQEGDVARYNELQTQMRGLSLQDKFGPKGTEIRTEIEAIKNRNGGNPPDKAAGLGPIGETKAAFQPRTEKGRKVEEQGFRLVAQQLKPTREASQVVKLALETKGGFEAGSIEYFVPKDQPTAAYVEFIEVGPKWQGKGFGEALYREAFAAMQEQGINQVDGFIVSDKALKLREKILPGATKTKAMAGRYMPIEEAIQNLEGRGLGVSARTRIPEGFKFQPRPNEDVKRIATEYASARLGDYKPSDRVIDVNPDLAKKLADFYESAESKPTDPEVLKSYEALAKETVDQYNSIVEAGYTLEPFTGQGEPYKTSADMIADVRDNKHLYFLKTEEAGTFDSTNPMMLDSGINGWPVNDVFRAVHDFFGHAKDGYQFGPKGELNAWKSHSEMYSPEAQGALAAETLAQNSWVNYGKHLRDKSGKVPAKGETGYVPPTERPFAPQKNLVIPPEMIAEARRTADFQFTPKKDEPRAVKAAAIQLATKDAPIYEGAMHYLAQKKAQEALGRELSPYDFVEGFITNEGEFLTREAAYNRAIQLKQMEPTKAVEEGISYDQSGKEGLLESVTFDDIRQFAPKKDKPNWKQLAARLLKEDKERVNDYLGGAETVREAAAELAKISDVTSDTIIDLPGTIRDAADALYSLAYPETPVAPEAPAPKTTKRAVVADESLVFRPAIKGGDNTSKAWILPNGEIQQLGGKWHHEYLAENKSELANRWGLTDAVIKKFGDRQGALAKGFVRMNLNTANGQLSVEARARDWNRTAQKAVYDAVDANAGKIDKIRVNLFDDKVASVVESAERALFRFSNDEKAANIPLLEAQTSGASRPVGQGPGTIERARALPWEQPQESQFQPGREFFTEEPPQPNPKMESEGIQKAKAGWDYNIPAFVLRNGDRMVFDTGTMYHDDAVRGFQEFTDLVDGDLGKPSVKFQDESGAIRVAMFDSPGQINDYGGGVLGLDFTRKPTESQLKAISGYLRKHEWGEVAIDWTAPDGTVLKATRIPIEGRMSEGAVMRFLRNPEGTESQFQPKRQEDALPGFDEIKEPLSTRELSQMNQKDRRQYYPEAVVPRSEGEIIQSRITESPLYKKSKTEDAAVKAFAERLVSFAKQYEKDPAYQRGAEWYSDFTPRLNKQFGKDANLFAELLAATSPNTNPEVNFGYAFDALKSYRAGRYDKIIPKFEEGLAKMEDGSWEKWYNSELKKGLVKAPPENPSSATFLAHWIDKHNLKPTQSNGKLIGMHGVRVLQVFARRWLDMNEGPKTRNFVENLIGKSHEATIDVWADRTMRWAGYEGYQPRWRILPENGTGVSDVDFAFSQKAFRHAAEQLGMKPSALQGALWFAEKKRWAENGWGRLDLGDFRTELEKVPLLEAGFDRRMKLLDAQKKAKPREQLGFDMVEPR
jgi:ribosomal protein S18 acetylase RimI-like enzyme